MLQKNLKNKLNTNKSGQLFLLSAYLILFGLIFIYSLETQNTYKLKSSKSSILNNVIYETCKIGKLSNGSYIDSRYSNFTINVNNYCNGFGNICNLTITKIGSAPTNLSQLNYTHYNYSILYKNHGYDYEKNFTC